MTIETVDGPLNIKIPAGSQDGDKITLQKYGAWAFQPPDNYDPSELRGDFVLNLQIVIPKSFTENQK